MEPLKDTWCPPFPHSTPHKCLFIHDITTQMSVFPWYIPQDKWYPQTSPIFPWYPKQVPISPWYPLHMCLSSIHSAAIITSNHWKLLVMLLIISVNKAILASKEEVSNAITTEYNTIYQRKWYPDQEKRVIGQFTVWYVKLCVVH